MCGDQSLSSLFYRYASFVCVQLTLRDLTNHEPTVHELNEAVEAIVSRSSDPQRSPLVSKQREMDNMYGLAQVLARDQTHMLRDRYRQVHLFTFLSAVKTLAYPEGVTGSGGFKWRWGRWGRPLPYLLIFFSKSRFVSCKRHIFRCAHLRQLKTQLINCLLLPFSKFWIRQWLRGFKSPDWKFGIFF